MIATPPRVEETEIEISEPQARVIGARTSVILDMAGQGSGKSQIIGYLTAETVMNMKKVKQFVGANTYMQLSQSTLARVFDVWDKRYGMAEYDIKGNPGGAFVVGKKPPFHFDKIYKFEDYNNIISFHNGATIFTGSLENYKAHEGKEFAIAHLDETKDTKVSAVTDVIMGRLRQYGLWFDLEGQVFFDDEIKPEQAQAKGWKAWNPLYIHTSPAIGGTPWLNEMFKLDKFQKEIKKEVLKGAGGYFYKEFDNKTIVIYPTHHNLHNLPPNYIENQISNQTKAGALRVVYGYPFGQTGGAFYPGFDRDKHVVPCYYKPGLTVALSLDFNVVPFMTMLCIQVEYVTRFVDELGRKHRAPRPGYRALEVMVIRVYRGYFLENPRNSTEHLAEAFREDHSPGTCEVDYYGDASGLHRIPGLGSVTNFKILEAALEDYLHNHSKKVKDPNVGVWKRRDLLEKILEGKVPTVELEIDPSVEKLIEDFENVKEGKNGKAKIYEKDEDTGEKVQRWGHPTDALEYFVSEACKDFLD